MNVKSFPSKCYYLMACIVFCLSADILHAGNLTVVASVDDTPITEVDLNLRLTYVIHTSGMTDTPETRGQLRERVLNKMIEERLQVIEAKERGIHLAKADVMRGLASIEQREGLAAGDLLKIAAEIGVPEYIVLDQVRASMVWGELVSQSVRGRENLVSDVEVDALIRSAEAQALVGVHTISEMFFPIESPSQDASAHKEAVTALEKLKQGARFPELARHLSKSASAAQGGLIGQLIKGVFEPVLESAMLGLKEGQLSDPIRGQGGYYIFFRHPSDTLEYTLLQLAIPFSSENEARAAAELIHKIRQEKMSCSVREKTLKEQYAQRVQVTMNEHVHPGRLNPKLLEILKKMPSEQLTPAINAGRVMLSMAVCKIDELKPQIPTREQAKESLIEQKMSQMAQRIMREMRRTRNIQTDSAHAEAITAPQHLPPSQP
jgi:peptidyl-prolyl cis-trans isomerase SurA